MVLFMIKDHPTENKILVKVDDNVIILNIENQKKLYYHLRNKLYEFDLKKALNIIDEIEGWNEANVSELNVLEVYPFLEKKTLELRKILERV